MRASESHSRWDVFAWLCYVAAVGFVVSSLAGCGSAMTNYYRAAGTALDTSRACATVLRAVTEKKHADYDELKAAGDDAGAELLKTQWLDQYGKALTACQALRATGEEALAAAPIVEHAINRDKDAMGWIARLVALGAETIRLLSEFGIKLPGGG